MPTPMRIPVLVPMNVLLSLQVVGIPVVAGVSQSLWARLSPARMRPILVALSAASHDPRPEWGLFTDASRLRGPLVTFVHSVGASFREWSSHAMFMA